MLGSKPSNFALHPIKNIKLIISITLITHLVNYKKSNDFIILFGREDEKITKISQKYKDVPISEKLAIFGENNLLQIAINQGEANKLLGLNLHEIIRIEFK